MQIVADGNCPSEGVAPKQAPSLAGRTMTLENGFRDSFGRYDSVVLGNFRNKLVSTATAPPRICLTGFDLVRLFWVYFVQFGVCSRNEPCPACSHPTLWHYTIFHEQIDSPRSPLSKLIRNFGLCKGFCHVHFDLRRRLKCDQLFSLILVPPVSSKSAVLYLGHACRDRVQVSHTFCGCLLLHGEEQLVSTVASGSCQCFQPIFDNVIICTAIQHVVKNEMQSNAFFLRA